MSHYNRRGIDMALTTGSRFASYEIALPLGTGGMGEVYKARDTRLNRDVALKLLREPFLIDPDRLARFRREAQVLASLNHPHIAAIYGIEESGGVQALVLELVDGPTLADLIAQGPLPIDEALRIGKQIAQALEAAHEQSAIHRDLKPANIKVRSDGTVKVLDFGLAKVVERDMPTGAALDASPTITSPAVTRLGVILGTAAYMAPEQAKGRLADKRCDIWAFGCVFFEMLTGKRAFPGDDLSETLAAVIKSEPDWNALPATTPAPVRRLLRRCLEKDPTRRLRDIGDVRLDVEDAIDSLAVPPATATEQTSTWRQRIAVAVVLIGIGVLIGALTIWRLNAPPADRVVAAHFQLSLPPGEQLGGVDFPAVAAAPDGSALAYVGTRGGQTQLYFRRMDTVSAAPIAGTTNASAPFFSPDGRWIAFFADGRLKKVAVSGGVPIEICRAPVGVGGHWSESDSIVFAANTGSSLSRVSAYGGVPQRVTNLDAAKGEFSHRWPEWLPGGETVVYAAGQLGSWDDADIIAESLTTERRALIVHGGTNPHYLRTGQLIYAHRGAIMSIPFDVKRLASTGTPIAVLENVRESPDGAAQLAVSRTGTVAYVTGTFDTSERRRLVSISRTGVATPYAADPAPYASPRVSPDGRKLLLTLETTAPDLWIYDVTSASLTQFTFDAGARYPIWAPGGQRVTYTAAKGGAPNLFMSSLSQPGLAQRLAPSENQQIPGSWSPDGTALAFVERRQATGRAILLASPGENPTTIVDSMADESAPRISPDGHWLAYVSNESGQNEVYVRPFGGKQAGSPVWKTAGTEPVWAPRGRELFYREGNKLMTVRIGERAPTPQMLFEGDFARGTIDAANYDVTPDGERFIMIQPEPSSSAPATVDVVINWFTTLTTPSSR